jgi:hypothetical protein
VDEDHLDGYYYDLLQEYKRHKTSLESQLFYNCLMYQWADLKKLKTKQWLEPIREFVETEPVHPIPKARRLAILMLETDSEKLPKFLQNEVEKYINDLNDDAKIIAVLLMLRLLFAKRRNRLVIKLLSHLPDSDEGEKDIWTQINLNQLKIYKAYALFLVGEAEKASRLLQEFEPYLVNNFIRETIFRDYKIVHQLIIGK